MGAVIHPTALAALTAAVTIPIATAMRALRRMKKNIPLNIDTLPGRPRAPQFCPFIKVDESLT
jgi:hypothetical protein